MEVLKGIDKVKRGLAVTYYDDPHILAEVSEDLGEPMLGIDVRKLEEKELLQVRGW
jgi:pyridoxal 5'-phosphate synthase pdxS subunit